MIYCRFVFWNWKHLLSLSKMCAASQETHRQSKTSVHPDSIFPMDGANRRRSTGTLFLRKTVTVFLICLLVETRALSVLPVPDGKTYLPFQRESIESLARSNRILLADEMGTGKTIKKYIGLPSLFFCTDSTN